MKFTMTQYTMMLLASLLIFPSLVQAGEVTPNDGKKREPLLEEEPMDARTLLEQGQASGSFPGGMIIRMGACLGGSDKDESGKHVADEMRETWEFTSTQVHRVVFEYKDEKSIYHRVETHPFNTKGICKDLLVGKAIDIQAKKGEGPEVAFVGTRYHLGSRFIELVWNGKTILELRESRAAELELYRESDARAFGALYEKLASQVSAVFKEKDAGTK